MHWFPYYFGKVGMDKTGTFEVDGGCCCYQGRYFSVVSSRGWMYHFGWRRMTTIEQLLGVLYISLDCWPFLLFLLQVLTKAGHLVQKRMNNKDILLRSYFYINIQRNRVEWCKINKNVLPKLLYISSKYMLAKE